MLVTVVLCSSTAVIVVAVFGQYAHHDLECGDCYCHLYSLPS